MVLKTGSTEGIAPGEEKPIEETFALTFSHDVLIVPFVVAGLAIPLVAASMRPCGRDGRVVRRLRRSRILSDDEALPSQSEGTPAFLHKITNLNPSN